MAYLYFKSIFNHDLRLIVTSIWRPNEEPEMQLFSTALCCHRLSLFCPEMKHQIEYVRAVLLRLPRPFYSSPFFSISAIEGADRKSGAALALVVYEALKQIRQITAVSSRQRTHRHFPCPQTLLDYCFMLGCILCLSPNTDRTFLSGFFPLKQGFLSTYPSFKKLSRSKSESFGEWKSSNSNF